MMEIIFRGKRVDNGEWVYGWYCMYSFGQWPLKSSIIPSKKAHDGFFEPIEVENTTVGQYTGLKDKNGKLIFEGDIVAYNLSPGIKLYAICDFYKGSFVAKWIQEKVACIRRKEFTPFSYYDVYDIFDFEIIGNIHDNPELID